MPAAEEPPPALPPCPLRVRAAKMDFRGFPHTAAWWDTATAQREGCVQQARIDIVGNLQSCMDLLPNEWGDGVPTLRLPRALSYGCIASYSYS